MPRSTTDLEDLEARVGYQFRDRSLLDAALTHSSALPSGPVRSSEQLEFLGDAVLDLAIANLMLRSFPDQDEGQLSKWRAVLVRTRTLAGKARQLGIGEVLLLGRGEERSGGRSKESILAASYESVVGAIFRDGGFSRAEAVVARHFRAELTAGPKAGAHDWKTQLQELSQARFRTVPEYRLSEERGPPHARHFTTEVWVAGEYVACGDGHSKREAEQQAARVALEKLRAGEES